MSRRALHSTSAIAAGAFLMIASTQGLAAGSRNSDAVVQRGHKPSIVVVQDNDWSSQTNVSDCNAGWASAYADDSWSVKLSNPTDFTVTATDEFCVGDYYNVFRDGNSMGTTPNPGAWGCDASGTLSSGSFEKKLPAGTYTITVKDLGFKGHSSEEISDQGMCPAGFGVSGTVTPVRPTGERTEFLTWSNDPTIGKWQQTLLPAGWDFSGEQVQERDPGGGGPDTCWFSGSAFRPFTTITGGTWTVATGNKWGADYVGWKSQTVTYYRNALRAPCGTTFPQQMTIQAAIDVNKAKGFVDYPVMNILGGQIGTTTVSSTRAGVTQTRVWP